MVRSSCPSLRRAVNSDTPAMVPTMPPANSIKASARSIARRRQYVMAPENDDAAIWLDTVATATAGAMPMKISNGVIRNPPPMPNMPEMKPTASPIANTRNTLTGRSAIGR